MIMKQNFYYLALCTMMHHKEYLQLLLKTGTGDMDLIKLGHTKMEIKMWKKGTTSIPAHIQKYLQQRLRHE